MGILVRAFTLGLLVSIGLVAKGDTLEKRVIFKLKSGCDPTIIQSLSTSKVSRIKSFKNRNRVFLAKMKLAQDRFQYIHTLRNHQCVKYAEEDSLLEASGVQLTPQSLRIEPNDRHFPSQWNLQSIRAGAAWQKTIGSSDVIVAILDSGIANHHPDLDRNVLINPREIPNNGIDDDQNGYVDDYRGYHSGQDSGNARDGTMVSHGTHISGIVGAIGNNSIGVAGVNWSVSLLVIKFLRNNLSGPMADAIAGIYYALDRGAKVINASFGSTSPSAAFIDAIEEAKEKGVLIIASAGNQSTSYEQIRRYPAAYSVNHDNVIAVASVNREEELASYSNWGVPWIQLAAPGSKILSTVSSMSVFHGNQLYSENWGTSFAAPHVTGAAALYWSRHPEASYLEVKNAILDSTRATPLLNGRVTTGGMLDLTNLLPY